MIKAHVFTNDYRLINFLKNIFCIKKIITENLKVKKKFNNKKFGLLYVKSISDLSKLDFNNTDVAICFGFGIIFDKNLIKKYKLGIWNIHPGKLPEYRGRHPITAAFLNNDKQIGISIHSINEKIDRGYMLASSSVQRTLYDDEMSIISKILNKIPQLLKKAISNYMQRKIKKIFKGKYFKPFYDGIEIINSKKYSYMYIYNAAKAQKSHGGIIVNNQKFKDAIFYRKSRLKKTNKVIICKDNKKLILIKK